MSYKGRVVGSKPTSLRRCDPLLTKLMSPIQLYFPHGGLCLSVDIPPPSLPQVAYSRSLIGSVEGGREVERWLVLVA